MTLTYSLAFTPLREQLRRGELTPALARDVLAAAATGDRHHAWIHRVPVADVLARAQRLEADPAARALPLYGIPFAVKDNIDVAGCPTTAACPSYAYEPAATATAVQRLLDAGAILIGKTNLDPFATGLVGTRSPYGATRNAFDPAFVSGGSSSGSAVAVAKGLASFALGSDTAGSGRVPAAFNNLVGIKPTRGIVSTRGVVPACRTLDCVSVFALDLADTRAVVAVAAGFDREDPFARAAAPGPAARERFRFGVPARLEFFGDAEAARLFANAVDQLQRFARTPPEFLQRGDVVECEVEGIGLLRNRVVGEMP